MLGWLARKKYQFEAVTSLTMLEPSEKRILCILQNVACMLCPIIPLGLLGWLAVCHLASLSLTVGADMVMFLLLLMTMYTLVVYLPPHLRQLVTFVSGY